MPMNFNLKTLLHTRFSMDITGKMSDRDAGIAAKRIAACVGAAILILALTPALYIIARWW